MKIYNDKQIHDLLSVDEVAALLNCNRQTIYGWISKGQLEALKINGLVRVKKENVLKLIKQ